jgi:arylsulfatase A-like enzyme
VIQGYLFPIGEARENGLSTLATGRNFRNSGQQCSVRNPMKWKVFSAEGTQEARPSPEPGLQSRSAALDFAATLSFSGVALLSSMYCLLAYIPSTYFPLIHTPFLSWMPVFAKTQPYLFLITFFVAAASILRRYGRSPQKRLALEIIALGGSTSAYLFYSRLLARIGNNSASFVWALIFLFLIICFGAVEYSAWLPQLTSRGRERVSFSYWRVIAAALFISISYPSAGYLRYFIAGSRELPTKSDLVIMAWAAITLILVFLAVFSVIMLAGRMADATANPAKARFIAFSTFWVLAIAFVMYKLVLASIPFEGTEAVVYAATFSMAVVTLAGGRLLRRRVTSTASLLPEQAPSTSRSRSTAAALWLFLLAANLTVPALIGAMDWNSVLEKSWVITYWLMVAAVVVFRKPQPARVRVWVPVLTALLSLFALRVGAQSEVAWAHTLSTHDFDATTALARHIAQDASFAAAEQLLAPAISPRPCNEQCEFIRHQTNVSESQGIDLHNIDLVEGLKPLKGDHPNIFIIVVDSLRQDYISAYNPAVSFTPAIGAFARDSVVFRNAFTRYGGTALAEPSIWSGMMLLHKHYVQPFHLVNGLEKLIETDGYKPFITIDDVLKVVIQPSPQTVQLDANESKWTETDFCSTASEVITKIDYQQGASRPIFLYTQPQNVHLVTLSKIRSLRQPSRDYAPFVSDYASELERLDGCFGQFIESLKTRGLYNNSIIVLTADHGEGLKKSSAEHHAFSLRPDVIRVPLIIHVPQHIKKSWYYAPGSIAFNVDITPTLYELLGHGPVINRPEFGRPLFTKTKADWEKYSRDSYLIASSYGPLYGLLFNDGNQLFIESEVSSPDGTEEFFDLARDPQADDNILTDQVRQKSEKQLRTNLQQTADLYGYQYKSPTILDWLLR